MAGDEKEEGFRMKVSIFVSPKAGVLNPQGQAALGALKSLGFDEVSEVSIGRYITLEMQDTDKKKAEARVTEMCDRLLANPIIEDYRVQAED
jgi:phosphoribosylformylglycinamidine synthase PurS subunit